MRNQIEKMTITPAIAAEFLKHNNTNRPLSQKFVTRYAKEMSAGNWLFNGTTISFDKDGNLLDGQHRLQACIQSGVRFDAIIVRGVEKDAFSTYDCGRARDLGQLLAIEGILNYNTVSASLKMAWMLNKGMVGQCGHSKGVVPTNKECVSIYRSNEDAYNETGTLAVRLSKSGKWSVTTGFIGGVYFHLVYNLHHSKEKVIYFLEGMLSYDTCDNPTIDRLRKRLLDDRNGNGNMKLTQAAKQNMIAKAWNAYIEGRELKCIKWDSKLETNITFK